MLIPSNSDCRVENDERRSRKTNYALGGYVGLGVLLVGLRSKLDAFYGEVIPTMGVLSILFLSVLSGVVTVHYRDKVLKQQRTFYRDPTLITKPDGHTMKFGAILLLIGNVAMIVIQPTTVEVSHLLMFILFVVSVGLNIYFGSFLFGKTAYQGYDSHVESLKLAHHEWATIFNNVCIALLVSVGGVALGFMKPADGFLPADWATPRPLTS